MDIRKGICTNPVCDHCESREVQEVAEGEEFVCIECGEPLELVEEKNKKRKAKKEKAPKEKRVRKERNTSIEKRERSPLKKSQLMLGLIIVVAIIAIAVVLFLWRPWQRMDRKTTFAEVTDTTVPFVNDTFVETDTLILDDPQNDSIPTTELTIPTQPNLKIDKKQKEYEKSTVEEKKIAEASPSVHKVSLDFASYLGDSKNGKAHGVGEMKFKKRHIIPGTIDCIAESGDRVEGSWREGKVNGATWYHKDGSSEFVMLGQRHGKEGILTD